jgi:hypothetical protein
MQIINIIYKHRCVSTDHEERVMGDLASTRLCKGKGAERFGRGAKLEGLNP